ncbi:MAG TPA: BatD family protein [Verrucomicrobiae bacterium]|nr:BatD family protein [Verrucomicrobiae bacterium]
MPEPTGNEPKSGRTRRFVWLLLACLGWLAVLPAQAATVNATLSAETVPVGEGVTLTLSFEGGSPDSPPPVPSQPNLRVDYAGANQRFAIINGQSSSGVDFNYNLSPSQPGSYTVPSLSFTVGGQTLRTQPLRLTVAKAAEVPNQIAFLRLLVPKDQVYVGEMFFVELRLYIQAGRVEQMPQLAGEGFTFGKMPQPGASLETMGNQRYKVYTFRLAATAVKAGDLQLGPAETPALLPVASNRQRQNPLEAFEDSIFGGRVSERRVTLRSESKTMKVLPLPADNVPASFAGAVGQFTMSATVGPTNVSAGDPITVRVRIAGRGALDLVSLPPQEAWREFKTYPPTSQVNVTDAFGTEGVKMFEQIVAPENAEVKELPALLFSYFDPEARAYKTLTYPPTPLTVRPAAAIAQPTVLAATKPANSNEPPPVRDIVHIKADSGALLAIQPPLALRPWFLLLQGIPLLAYFAAFGWRKRGEHLASHPRLVRRRQVDQTIRKGVVDLRRFADAGDSNAFFVAAFRLLQERLGERLNLPAAATTEAVVEEQLRPRKVDEKLLGELAELFQACNQARYAPVRSQAQLASLRERVEGALEKLGRLELDAK